jgi:cytochrome c-type biogenesis protein CcmF
MVRALLTRDFSVSYVAQVGSRAVPDWVAFVSLWSSLEGSILFWGLVIGVYVGVATWANRDKHPEYMPWAVAVWLACGAFFAFLLSGPAQPFQSVSPIPPDGPGPNPLLQNHLLMVVHPPCLYLGYVGMTIPFGLACAALLTGRLGHDFLRPLRTWLMLPWTFLTVAIVLGGWWAYEVLGWGGYWAWDPVENASFLPWLTATAALHSALLTERKGVLKGWTVTLVLATFLLTILGTFMTRSGVFNSVPLLHAERDRPHDPGLPGAGARLVGGAARAAHRPPRARRHDRAGARARLAVPRQQPGVRAVHVHGPARDRVPAGGRGGPRRADERRPAPTSTAWRCRSASVLLLLMGVGPALPWGRATAAQVRQALLPPLAGAALFAAVGMALGVRKPWTLVALAFGGYTVQVTLRELWLPIARRRSAHGEGLGQALVETGLRRGRRRFGSYIVHAGAATVIVAIAVSSTMGESREAQLRCGREDHGRRLHAHLRRRRPGERAAPGGGGRTRVGGARRPGARSAEPAHEPVRATARADRHARGAQLPLSRTCISR